MSTRGIHMKSTSRKHKRYLQSGLIDLKVNISSNTDSILGQNDKLVCFINDISRSGIGGRALNPLPEGESVVVKRVRLLKEDIECDIPATVLWTKTVNNNQRFGISLEEELQCIDSYVKFSA
jgi:hypothetical protein